MLGQCAPISYHTDANGCIFFTTGILISLPINYAHFHKYSLGTCKDKTFISTTTSYVFYLKLKKPTFPRLPDSYCPEVLKIYMSDTDGLTYYKSEKINGWYNHESESTDKKHIAKKTQDDCKVQQ